MTRRSFLYTGTGDGAETALGKGRRISKDAAAIEVYGALDEANAFIGLAALHVEDEEAIGRLREIQDDLILLGGALYRLHSGEEAAGEASFWENRVRTLETMIDATESGKTPLTRFQRPGSTAKDGYLHVARTVVRRAERALAALSREVLIPGYIPRYVNRLSDFLFSLATRSP